MNKNKLFDAKNMKVTEDTFDFDTMLEYEQILFCVSNAIINYRKEKEITQKQLAEMLKMQQAMISKLERGTYNPTFKMVYNVSRELTKSSDLFVKILKDIIKKIYDNKSIIYNLEYKSYEKYEFKIDNSKDNVAYLSEEYIGQNEYGGSYYGESRSTSLFSNAG
jgi:transcriptional regulator with XRE-family HTH domain